MNKNINLRLATIADYDGIFELWNSEEQSRRAMNPVDDTREGIARYMKRNPNTCFVAQLKDGSGDAAQIVGVILTGHDGRRAIVHHLCVHPDFRRDGLAGKLVAKAEEALRAEGINKIFGLVFKDNGPANSFWERQGYTLRTDLNYRNKSLNPAVPQGE
ncbi:MAG: GNAT family N-acetyltransferase [Treponema sp.]|nr:GNAT family N-acetyltransferase [Treponema sp.]